MFPWQSPASLPAVASPGPVTDTSTQAKGRLCTRRLSCCAGGGTESFNAVIKNASEPDSTVYDTNRVGSSFQYGFTKAQGIKPNRLYTIVLHTADLYWTHGGNRTFSVSANGAPTLTDYDVIAEAGALPLHIASCASITTSPGSCACLLSGIYGVLAARVCKILCILI